MRFRRTRLNECFVALVMFVITCLTSVSALEPVKDYASHSVSASEVLVTCEGTHKVRLIFRRPKTVEVTFAPDGNLSDDIRGNYPVWLKLTNWPGADVSQSDEGDYIRLTAAGGVTVRVYKAPFRLEFWDESNAAYIAGDEDSPGPDGIYGMGGTAGEFLLRRKKSDSEHFFGFGDNFCRGSDDLGDTYTFDRTGAVVTEIASYQKPGLRMLAPFYFSTDGYGIYVHVQQDDEEHTFSMKSPVEMKVTHKSGEGRSHLTYLFFYGPDYPGVMERYTEAVGVPDVNDNGRPPLMSKWVFGIHYGAAYTNSNDQWKEHVTKMRDNKLPFDVVVGDRNYSWPKPANSDGYCFFENMDMVNWLTDRGVHFGANMDPHREHTSSKAGGHRDFNGPNDNYMEATHYYVDHGFDLLWSDALHGIESTHHDQVRENFTAMKTAHGGKESDIFMVSGWNGWVSQAFPTIWPGDVYGTVKTDLGGSMVGHAYATHDGGDGKWKFVALGLSAVARYHACGWGSDWPYKDDNKKEPFRKWANFRYRLIPYLFTYGAVAHEKGHPIMRHMIWEYWDNPTAYDKADGMPYLQYFLGDWLLVAPREPEYHSREEVKVWLPSGTWYDWFSNERHQGEKELTCDLSSVKPGLFVKEGAIIPLGPVQQYVGEVPEDPVTLRIWPGDQPSGFTLYEDETPVTTSFTCSRTESQISVGIGAFPGSRYSPSDRSYVLEIHCPDKPVKVVRNNASTVLAEFEGPIPFETAPQGWLYEEARGGVLTVKPGGSAAEGFNVYVSMDGSVSSVTRGDSGNFGRTRIRRAGKNRFHVHIPAADHSVEVCDMRGRTLTRRAGTGARMYTVDLSAAPAGMFVCKIKTNGRSVVRTVTTVVSPSTR